MTKWIAALLAFMVVVPLADAQRSSAEDISKLARELIDEAFPEPRGPHAEVVLLGTFHFKDAGLDGYKPQHAIDVFEPDRQREIEAIAAALAAFKPTKVAVEAKPEREDDLQSQFASYRNGEWTLPANEIYQLGFRIAKAAGHDRVYPVDAPGRWFDERVDIDEFAKKNDQAELLRDPYQLSNYRLSLRLDKLKVEQPLREHLLLLNDAQMLANRHSIYLSRKLALREGDEYPGADGFVSQWYNRNLRIFGNMQRITESENERILVIIGAGHVPILRHFVSNAPNMTLVEVSEYL